MSFATNGAIQPDQSCVRSSKRLQLVIQYYADSAKLPRNTDLTIRQVSTARAEVRYSRSLYTDSSKFNETNHTWRGISGQALD
jgi:hypothetical protein